MKRWLLTALALIAIAAVGGFLYAWSGLYSVAASAGHFPAVRWFLEFGMRNSVQTHSLFIEPPPLDDPLLVLKGAGHYQGGCAPCHGGPGEARNPIVQHMLPEPPYLVDKVPEWNSDELFWIVLHGLKYTGMPSWVAPQRTDEVWAVVAFLRRLPQLSPEQYRQLARGDVADFGEAVENAGRVLALTGPVGDSLAACARCHDFDGSGRGLGAFPRLAGQKPEYLYQALESYAIGERPSGIMQPPAAALGEREMRALAEYFAAQTGAPYPAVPEADGAALALGRTLALEGLPDAGVPACASCHGPGDAPQNPLYPELAGQYFDYLALQLRLFKQGIRGGTEYAELMTAVAQDLSAEQIRAVALYYASLRPAQTRAGGTE